MSSVPLNAVERFRPAWIDERDLPADVDGLERQVSLVTLGYDRAGYALLFDITDEGMAVYFMGDETERPAPW